MPTCTLTVGLPAAGKTTWATARAAENPDVVVVCLDDVRAEMFPGLPWTLDRVRAAAKIQQRRARAALTDGHDVIVADTNLNPVVRTRWVTIAAEAGAALTLEVFDVPVEECIRRDAMREAPVGEVVIRHYARTAGPVGAITMDLAVAA